MIHFCILFSFFSCTSLLKSLCQFFQRSRLTTRRSNPRFSVADAKVLRVFGIAKPIHYFFEKTFKSELFWEKMMRRSEEKWGIIEKRTRRYGGSDRAERRDWHPLLYIGVVGGCSWWVDRFYQGCSYFSSLEKGVNWESRRESGEVEETWASLQ